MHDAILHDVVIAGAGPVGLFLACELALAGIAVLVLEAAEHPHSPLKSRPFGLRGLNIPSVEALHRRGLLDAIKAQRQPTDAVPHWMRQPRAAGGHFAGIQFFRDQVDTTQWPYHLPGPADTTVASDMAHLEAVLTARAVALGVEIRRGQGVMGLAQSEQDVTLDIGKQTIRTRWLVGCDGGRSTVRRAAGFGFAGTDPEFTGYSVEVALADPDLLIRGRQHTDTGMYTYQPPGTITMVDFDGGARHRAGPLTREHVQSVLRHISGKPVTVDELKIATTWTDRAFQATQYRRGRVLLAGDAAHIHSPLGGQGLNLGIGDAMNLGWKLAATLRGDAPAGLLDTYHDERHPIGAQILDWSRAQVTLMRPTPGSRALADIVRSLIETSDGTTYFADRVWGMSLRYPLPGTHPLIGCSAPDFRLDDGSRLGELLRDGQGVLLDLDPAQPLQGLASHWRERVVYVAGTADDTLGLGGLLVRPDGVVAWAGEANSDASTLVAAGLPWFCAT